MTTIRPENIHAQEVRPEDEQRVHEKLDAKIKSVAGKPGGMLDKLIADVRTLYDLITDDGFQVEWADKAKIIACLLYFITPIDLIPDFIVGVGYLDDAVVIGYTLKVLSDLVTRYRNYRATNPKRDGFKNVKRVVVEEG